MSFSNLVKTKRGPELLQQTFPPRSLDVKAVGSGPLSAGPSKALVAQERQIPEAAPGLRSHESRRLILLVFGDEMLNMLNRTEF
ncbi:hypothetical protein EYF80_028392 [Liparis tanakae]|uniref:Uncharacterized protein n=1 Tax=Liparis tanakae TaxID=230148 RepID=A0A4Z2H807_9TELE|nr:hypothetical protein EYF80_028392 [Liparis tanakae]